MLFVETLVQALAQPDAEQQQRCIAGDLRQCGQQAAVKQEGQGQQAVEGEPDGDQGGAQACFIQLGAGQGKHQQRAARGKQAMADTVGDEVAGSLDDLIVMLVSQQWRRPPSARNGMSVEVLIEMLPDGTITNASVTRSSGDSPFDNSAVQAVRNVGRIAEMQQLDRATFDRLYRQRRAVFKPEDLGL